MARRAVRFKQVDVFCGESFRGNPLAVVFDADGLDDASMQAIARWTNLSETTFLCEPTDPAADYRVRIFCPECELPFAGHPTLGTAHAFVESGGVSRAAGRLVQQCGAGLIEIETRADGIRAFAAPRATLTALPAETCRALNDTLGTGVIDFTTPPTAIDNGVRWLMVRLASADACLALAPEPAALAKLVHAAGMSGLAVFGPHPAGGPTTFEMRCIVTEGSAGVYEDPVTGSANAGLASLLDDLGARPGAHYTVRQGTALGRDGRVFVEYDDAHPAIWVGGAATTTIDGTIRLP
jgi:PhzF family phenazine biosynthesis protein